MDENHTDEPPPVYYVALSIGRNFNISINIEPVVSAELKTFSPIVQAISLIEAKRIRAIFTPIFTQNGPDLTVLMESLKDLQRMGTDLQLDSDKFYPVFKGFIHGKGEKSCLIYRDLKEVESLIWSVKPRRWKRCRTLEGSLIFLLTEYMKSQSKATSNHNVDKNHIINSITLSETKDEVDSISSAGQNSPHRSSGRRTPHCKTCHGPMKGHVRKIVCPTVSDIVRATEKLSLSNQEDKAQVPSNGKLEFSQFRDDISEMALLRTKEPLFFEVPEEEVIPLRRFALKHGLSAVIFDKFRDTETHLDDIITLIVSSSKKAIEDIYNEL